MVGTHRRAARPAALLILALALAAGGVGCVSARMSDHVSDRFFRERDYTAAAERLKKGLADQGANGVDQLLFLLDIGLSLHSAGDYEQSIKYLRMADQVAEIKDYTSLSQEGESLLTSENVKAYKGEDFEKVLINAYLAMNYALEGNWEDAAVEARRVNQKLYLMNSQGGRKYEQSAFARYLSAAVYEAEHDWNDAYVDYKNVHKLRADFPGLGRDLWRMSWLLEMPDQMEQWDNEYDLTAEDHSAARRQGPRSPDGEVIVIYENGISPVKRPNPHFRTLPMFFPRYNPVASAQISLDGKPVAQTAVLDDIEKIAIENLDEKYGGIIAKKLAGMAVKTTVAYGIERATNNQFLGQLAALALFASDQADLRSWNLLPKDLQVARVSVAPGVHSIGALPVGSSPLPDKQVTVKAGEKIFVDFRFMP